MKAETNSLKICLESHRFTSPRPKSRPKSQESFRPQENTLCSIGQAAPCRPKAGRTSRRRQPGSHTTPTPRGQSPEIILSFSDQRDRRQRSKGLLILHASPCNTLEIKSGEIWLECQRQPWKLGGSESGRNEALRPRKSFGFKRANLAAWSFGSQRGNLPRQQSLVTRDQRPLGYSRIRQPQASPRPRGGRAWMSGGLPRRLSS